MLSGVLKELGSLFQPRFLVGFWLPILVAGSAALLLVATVDGPEKWVEAWNELDPLAQFWLGLAAVIVVTVLAYLLDAMEGLVVRFYEGYWPDTRLWRWLAALGRSRQEARKDKLPIRQRYGRYPRRDINLMPTSLGNALLAAEMAPREMYGLDAVLWWPRLMIVVPETMRAAVRDALIPMLALLNLTTLFALLAWVGGAFVALQDDRIWLFLLTYLGGQGFAWLAYRAAVSQAIEYGHQVRTAFDLYRHDLLKALNLSVRDNLQDETELWHGLNEWLNVNHTRPWDVWRSGLSSAEKAKIEKNLFYAHHKSPPQPAKPQQVDLTLRWGGRQRSTEGEGDA